MTPGFIFIYLSEMKTPNPRAKLGFKSISW